MNQVFGTQYKQREIVLVPFPYSDLSSTKKRPVLIISNDDYNIKFEDILVCIITSNQFKDDYSVDLGNDDLEIGILPELSVVKTHKLFTIHKSKIIKRFSIVSIEFYSQVEQMILKLIKSKQLQENKNISEIEEIIKPTDTDIVDKLQR
jgi:mRNA interferase MazF